MSQKEKNKTPPELDDQLEEAAAKEAAEEPAEAEAGAPDPLMDELEALKDQAARQEEKYLPAGGGVRQLPQADCQGEGGHLERRQGGRRAGIPPGVRQSGTGPEAGDCRRGV